MKKAIALLLALVMVFALCACGGGDKGTADNGEKVVKIGVTCTNPNVTAGNSHYFRICFLDPFQGTVLANYASSELKAKKAYCLGENGNEYDQGLVTFFKQAFEKAGGTVVIATHDLDFAEQVSDDVAMMFDGEIACMEPPADFFADNVFYRA